MERVKSFLRIHRFNGSTIHAAIARSSAAAAFSDTKSVNQLEAYQVRQVREELQKLNLKP
jgi:hypothetical protein